MARTVEAMSPTPKPFWPDALQSNAIAGRKCPTAAPPGRPPAPPLKLALQRAPATTGTSGCRGGAVFTGIEALAPKAVRDEGFAFEAMRPLALAHALSAVAASMDPEVLFPP